MSLGGYSIENSGYKAQEGNLESNLEDLATANKELKTAVEDAKSPVKSEKISAALDSLYTDVLGANAVAALRRGRNAKKGASMIRRAIVQGDEDMANDAYGVIAKTPDFHRN
ncbi:hypothetical protein [Zhihengliuella halotolerans]|uniref:hypothetical protein n=1 Tax=Zhihengliuella halotolerans TaxID=370736 RepID=UPI000C801338|nr:hypothetical protein [Zhihengliuella halotolerans]